MVTHQTKRNQDLLTCSYAVNCGPPVESLRIHSLKGVGNPQRIFELSKFPTLTQLTLECRATTWDPLFDCLKTNSTLQRLSLGCCNVSDFRTLSEALPVNSTLSSLALGFSHSTLERQSREPPEILFQLLGESIKANRGLKFFKVSGWTSEPLWKHVTEALAVNNVLLHFECSAAPKEAIEALIDALSVNSTLTELHIPSCEFVTSVLLSETLLISFYRQLVWMRPRSPNFPAFSLKTVD